MKQYLVEVRLPTYKRPKLLRRALLSLQDQSHQNWQCIVMDDSSDCEGKQVCLDMDDRRITYTSNISNLGMCANLNNACAMPPSGSSDFLCVLEDDNYFLKDHFKDAIEKLDGSACDVLLRNHFIERSHDRESPGQIDSRTMYHEQYIDGVLPNSHLFAAFFYSIGATNCGLFWRANANIDFSTTQFVDDVVWQERLRTLCIDRPVYIAMEPMVVWRDNGPATWRVSPTGLGWYLNAAKFARLERLIYRKLYKYLVQRGQEHLIWNPPCGQFGHTHARVFHRVGIKIPNRKLRLEIGKQTILNAKRVVAQLLALFSNGQFRGEFDARRGRL